MKLCRPPERRACRRGLQAALLAVGLTACGDGVDNTATSVQPLPPRAVPPSASPLQPPSPPLTSPPGLTPLATPQQLLARVAIGRDDPFAPLQPSRGRAAAGAGPVQSALPADLRLLGLISGGRSAQAMVRIGSRSGALCPGPRGRCSGPDPLLLPPGWSVERIAAGQGLLVLRQGRQRQMLSLAPGS